MALPRQDKTSTLTTRALLEGISARFGAPTTILTEHWTKFRCKFETLLTHQGKYHTLASRQHPQSHGLEQRMVQTMEGPHIH